jgi:hypothetical protein
MRQKIHKGAKEMELGEWLKVEMQNDKEFIDAELNRIYHPKIDYTDGTQMGESDDCYGSTVDCFVFSKLYSLVVVLYVCDTNPSVSNTVIMDGRANATESIVHLQGIHPEKVPSSASPVLELVRYLTDIEIKRTKSKRGRRLKNPVLELAPAQGTPHYVFVRRSLRPRPAKKVLPIPPPSPANNVPPIPPTLVNQAAMTRSHTSPERERKKGKNEKPDPNQKQDPNHGNEDQGGHIIGKTSEEDDSPDDDKPPDDKNTGQSKEDEKKKKKSNENNQGGDSDLSTDLEESEKPKDEKKQSPEKKKRKKKKKKKKSNAEKQGGGSDSSVDSEESEKPNDEKKQSPEKKKRKKKKRKKSSKKSSPENPTPGVPLAAGLPKDDAVEAEWSWPDPTDPPKRKRKQLKLPIGKKRSKKKDKSEPSPPPSGSDDEVADDDDAPPNWKAQQRATRKNILEELTSVRPRPKMKSKGSNLRTQKELQSFFQTLESNDAHKKIRAAQYRQTILDKVGSKGREGKTLANLKERKAAGKQAREEKRLSEEATIGKIKKLRDAYLETVGKSGTTVLRNQLKWLEELFPNEDGIMNDDEGRDYNHYLESLPLTQSKGLKATDAIMTQLCSLQYFPKDPTPTTEFPYGNVAYVKGKVKVRVKSGPSGNGVKRCCHIP